ncbi:tyrosine-type recombinase/integrase [Aerococcaceae bacterium WGS1372]
MSLDWLAYYKQTVKKSTYIRGRTNVKRLNEAFGRLDFNKLTAAHFNKYFMDNLMNERFKYNTMKQIRSIVDRIIKHALKYHGIDKTEILIQLEVPKINVTVKDDFKYLEPDELNAILEYFKEQNMNEFARLVTLQVNTGMRFGEMVALDYEADIDLDEQSIHITKNYDMDNKIFTTPKTGDSRTIYFGDDIKKLIMDQIQYNRIKILKDNLDRGNKLLFSTKNGTPIRTGTMNKYLKRVDLDKNVTTHIFRHTFITHAVQNGMSKELIAQQVGHTDTSMIDKIYFHFTETMRKQQKEAMLDFKII